MVTLQSWETNFGMQGYVVWTRKNERRRLRGAKDDGDHLTLTLTHYLISLIIKPPLVLEPKKSHTIIAIQRL